MNLLKLFYLLSPTWVLADYLKRHLNRTRVITNLNTFYTVISVVSTATALIYQATWQNQPNNSLYNSLPIHAIIIWSYFLISRCNEIFWAFLRDAFDTINDCYIQNSKLTAQDRIRLSLKSYLELIFNFSLLYALLPANKTYWNKNDLTEIFDFIYFSGVTITTLGYGDISPVHWYPKLLTIYEVFCGFILLIVCFTIYTGKIGPTTDNSN
ncbi:potassium channel family protein [Desulfovibrio gilichinskyi]|uniref:Ion channel n=1 Tax=Desulfovibrio gilichinskyi TaxID=1519643 RepID=A0A1X7F1B4_9BACT|nr:potassium channel family protein [Desulfovibrio gilichinskyi]SMF44114.1 Ion channel [Desulfovibrio gilichinskyi]